MSGTSLDGLDVSLIISDGTKKTTSLYNITYNYSQEFKNDIKLLIKEVNNKSFFYVKKTIKFKKIELKFEHFIFSKILSFAKNFNVSLKKIDLVGFHGQTIFHDPSSKVSYQLGSGKRLSSMLNIPVVCNFRNADIINGGQGAPLVPIFHKSIFYKKLINTVVVNIGGISNITWIGKNEDIISSDIGPGNTLIDEFCNITYNKPYDKNGKIASKGIIDKNLIKIWLNFKFVRDNIPKSYDNFFFNLKTFTKNINCNKEDFIATLSSFTSRLIIDSEKFYPEKADRWILCGGGAKNSFLVNELRENLKNVIISNELGWNSDFIESQAFAYLAIRKLKNLESSFPSTTGVKVPTICGDYFDA